MIGPKAYIHSSRMKKNISQIKKEVSDKNLMIVVKANAYGHGLLNVVNILKSDKDLIFCTFSIEEAFEIRKNGILNRIFVFSKLQENWIRRALDNNIWVNASHFGDLELLVDFFKKYNSCPKIHLKFDTGMTRLGFDLEEHGKVFDYINQNPFLPVEGIYSHFSTADEGDPNFVETQLERFNAILKSGNDKGVSFRFVHCSNSGAILNNYGGTFNTVRVGMLAYGVAPSDEVPMKINVEPVMSFCGPIVNLRLVSKNTPVSYGGTYITKKHTNIGVIQMGFADGVPRPWYEDGYISYKGEKYNIAGRICMDQFMVDFGDVEPRIGDEVLVFGKKKDDFIPIETIAKKTNTTSYVLLTAIHGRTEYLVK
tara:strand:+ start:43 stop:1146 length:1104 start_codon:yes stop_codon:yes gene_type:complete